MDRRLRSLVFAIILAALVGVGVVVVSSRGSGGGGANRPIVWATIGAVAFAGVLLFVVLAGRRSSRPREPKPAKEQAAADLGLRYEAKGEKGFHHDFGPLPGIPHGGEIRHVMTGDLDGRPLTIFQHAYMINTGQATIPVQHVVYATPAPDWPVTAVRRRGALARVLHRLGVRRGLLLEDEAFNAVRRVVADDEDFALTLLHPEMQAFLAAKPSVTWAIHPGGVAMIYSGSLKFDRVTGSLDRFRAFWGLVPPELENW